MTTDSPDSLCGFLRTACVRAENGLSQGRAREIVAAVRERLSDDVLRIAVAGRLNAGKSTLVNALLRQKIAPTDATECTKIVTWFRYGDTEKVTLRLADGTEIQHPGHSIAKALATADLPPGEIGKVTQIEVRTRNVVLKSYAIVDTPGLDSTSEFDELSIAALGQADVLFFITPHPGENDRRAFARLRDVAAGLPAIGVLSRIDELDNGREDPWPAARRGARNSQRQLTVDVSMVIPVAGLLAETALGATFGEPDVHPLRRLYETARSDPNAVARYSASDFHDGNALPLSGAEGARLESLLGTYGIRAALSEFRNDVHGATDLLTALQEHSGINDLIDQLKVQFLSVADLLRARAAIRRLDAIAWPPAAGTESRALARLRDDLATATADPRFLLLDIVASLNAYQTGNWPGMPEDPTGELTAIVTGKSVADKLRLPPAASIPQVHGKLADRIRHWRVIEGNGNLDTTRRARAVREYLEALSAATRSA